MTSVSGNYWRLASYCVFALVAILIVATFKDYGLTADEEVQRIYGDKIIGWYSSFFRDRSALSYINLHLYGGFFETVAQLFSKISPMGVYDSRHLVNAIFGLASVVATYKLACRVSSPMVGFLSALFLTVTPAFYGQIFNNSKDIPFLALHTLSLWFLVEGYDALPRLPKSLVARIGITIGLAMGIRVGGIVLLGYVAVFFALKLFAQRTQSSFELRKSILRSGLSFLSIAIVAWVVMLVFWPWAQTKPFLNPWRALREGLHFDVNIRVLFRGARISADQVPASYLPTWFLIRLPEFYLASLLIGVYGTFRFLGRARRGEIDFRTVANAAVLILSFFFPLAMAIVFRSTVYNGLRHFLFVVPILSVGAAVSVAGLFESGANKMLELSGAALILLSVCSTALDMYQLHPYQYVYFNRLVAGGLKNAADLYDTDYWGMSYREGAEWVIGNYHPDTADKIRIAGCSTPFIARYYIENSEDAKLRFVYMSRDDKPRLLLATTKCHRSRKGNIIHTVARQGTPLLYVFEFDQRE